MHPSHSFSVSLILADPIDELLQRFELLLVDQVELLDEVEVMLEQGVAVSLGLKRGHPVEVVDVDVNEHAEHPGQDLLTGPLESLQGKN